jgi:hypothetical protein
MTKKMIAITTSAAAQIWATACQPKATMTNGALNFVTAAPTLPTPKMPSAVPCFSLGYQRLTYATPTMKEPPASPTPSAAMRNIG